ncbi:MAG: class I SAM-dependent methyltransferase [Verrucomicrobiota bacterium]|nr:class I SAM-dependent methyltransferase [Verrucomicrobiota bacterium]
MIDQSYDIGFSNSVIEHVGSWESQQQFASEIRRVAKALWVQTPAYECPIEPHYMTPFVHYLPNSLQKKILRWCTVRGWIERPSQQQVDFMVDTTRLLRKSEMQQLFPDCEIITEHMLWVIPKSYIAIRRKTKYFH